MVVSRRDWREQNQQRIAAGERGPICHERPCRRETGRNFRDGVGELGRPAQAVAGAGASNFGFHREGGFPPFGRSMKGLRLCW